MSRNPFTEAEVSKNRLIKASNVESYMNERRDVACPVGKRSFSTVKFEVMDGKKPKVANDNVIKLEPEEEQNVSLAAKNNDVSGAPKPLSRVSPQMPSSCITFAPFLCRNSLDASGDKLPINGLPSLDTIKSRPSDYTPQSPIAMSPPKTPTVCRGRGRPPGRAAVTPSRTPKSSPPSRTPELLRTPVKASRCGDHDPLRTPKRDCKTAGLSPTEEGSSKFLRTPARVRTPVKRYSNAEGRSIDDDEEIVFKICLDIVDNIILHGYSYFDNRLFKELCENYGINGANRSRLSQIKGALVQSLKSGRVPRWADDNPIWREKMEQAIKKLQGTMPQRSVQAITNNNSDSMMELQHLVDRISGEMRRKDENTEKIKNEVGELNTIVVKMESELAKKDNEINKLRRELSVIELPLNEAKLKKQTTCPGDIVVTVNKTTDDLPLANNTLKLPEHTRLPSMTYEELHSLFNDMSQQVADKEKYLAEVKRMMREKQP